MSSIKDSPIHGKGLFLRHKAQRGTLILVERPLVCLPGFSPASRDIWSAYQALATKKQQAEWWELKHFNVQEDQDRWAKEAGENIIPGMCGLILAKWEQNSFADEIAGVSFLAVRAARINHSCHANAIWVFNETTGNVEVRALANMNPGEEIFISYIPQVWERESRQAALKVWEIECQCVLCRDTSGADEWARTELNRLLDRLKLLGLSKPVDVAKQTEYYGQILELEEHEPCLAWETMIT
jgi:hypothetical protein